MFSLILIYMESDVTRKDAYKRTLASIRRQTFKDFEPILVEMIYDKQTDVVPEEFHHVKLYDVTPLGEPAFPRRMNKSWCINVGARLTKHDSLVFMDADFEFGEDLFQRIHDNAMGGLKFFQCYNEIVCEKGRDNPEERIRTAEDLRTAGGIWYVDKDFFWKIGGMNESYFGYGGEDNDFWHRANYVLKKTPPMSYKLTHCYHHWHSDTYELNPDRAAFLFKTVSHIPLAIDALCSMKLGAQYPQPLWKNTTDRIILQKTR